MQEFARSRLSSTTLRNHVPATATDIVTLIGTTGGWGLLALFVILLAKKRVAWWYQIEERDKRIEKMEAEHRDRLAEMKAECAEWKHLYFDSKQITQDAVSAVAATATRHR